MRNKTNASLFLPYIMWVCVLLAPSSTLGFTGHSENELNTTPNVVAFETLDGKLIKIDGNFYVVEDISGTQHRLRLSQHATLLRGPKKPGDSVRVEVIDARAITIE